MIGRLSGLVIQKQPPALMLDVNGVGYDIHAPMSTFYSLPTLGEKATLLIHTYVREDILQLYGFATEQERSLFRSLIRVSGIGAKLALTILSGITAEDFVCCVQAEDSTSLTRLPGVGKKTAQRLVVEMKDKLEHQAPEIKGVFKVDINQAKSPVEEAVTALISLGYKPNEASRMVRSVDSGVKTTEEVIRIALQMSVKQ